MHGEHGFSWLDLIPGLNQYPNHVVMSVIVGALMLITMLIARVRLNKAKSMGNALIPDSQLTYKNFFEIIAESLYKLTVNVMGDHEAAHFYPVIGSLFVFIFISNLVGLIPGLLPPTDNLNVTLALGAFVFLYYNFIGFKSNGLGYLKHFMGPIIWLAPLMFLIEVVSHVFRPLSLALRLRGNIMGDHIVLSTFNDLVPVLLPVIFYGLGVFVAFMQSFVFCLMTMVYISLSTSHDH